MSTRKTRGAAAKRHGSSADIREEENGDDDTDTRSDFESFVREQFKKILEGQRELQSEVRSLEENLEKNVLLLESRLEKLEKKNEDVEAKVVEFQRDADERIKYITQKLKATEGLVEELQLKSNKLERFSRRNNPLVNERMKTENTEISHTLVISPCEKKDAGRYTLHLQNPLGDVSVNIRVKVVGPPGPPTTPFKGIPDDNGGSDISNYIVEKRIVGQKRWYKVSSNVARTNIVVSRLEKDYQYLFRVAAENQYGIGPFIETDGPVTASGPIVPPDMPEHLDITRVTRKTVELVWKRPKYDGGSPITGYIVESRNLKELMTLRKELEEMKETVSRVQKGRTTAELQDKVVQYARRAWAAFDPQRAVALLQTLVTQARRENHQKAREFAIIAEQLTPHAEEPYFKDLIVNQSGSQLDRFRRISRLLQSCMLSPRQDPHQRTEEGVTQGPSSSVQGRTTSHAVAEAAAEEGHLYGDDEIREERKKDRQWGESPEYS
ncbi:Titin-like [Branchiostoma belcheri]|nr:Titin-like [Branchiostoma belcheri]